MVKELLLKVVRGCCGLFTVCFAGIACLAGGLSSGSGASANGVSVWRYWGMISRDSLLFSRLSNSSSLQRGGELQLVSVCLETWSK